MKTNVGYGRIFQFKSISVWRDVVFSIYGRLSSDFCGIVFPYSYLPTGVGAPLLH